MTPQSRKSKGRLAQQSVARMLLEAFPELLEGDIRSTPMGTQGDDIMMSPKASARLRGLSLEVKAQESLNIWSALKQAEDRKGILPAVVFKRNRSKFYIALDFQDFLRILSEANNA